MLSVFNGFAQEEQAILDLRQAAKGSRAKRATDVVLSALGLLFLSPVLLLIVVALLIVDGRPVIYRHSRVGQNGRLFKCLKFRSMFRDADRKLADLLERDPERRKEWRETQKLTNDPRVHWLGKLLRMTSADELPQLINVLRGEMSLVGPRPIVENELERYGAQIHYYLALRPGLTGIWQVERRQDTTYEERIQYDVDYYYARSLKTDVRIIWRTVGVVLLARNEKERLTK